MRKTSNIRLTAEEKEKAEKDASRYGMNFSQYIRFLLDLKHHELGFIKNGHTKILYAEEEFKIINPKAVNPEAIINWLSVLHKIGLIDSKKLERETKKYRRLKNADIHDSEG